MMLSIDYLPDGILITESPASTPPSDHSLPPPSIPSLTVSNTDDDSISSSSFLSPRRSPPLHRIMSPNADDYHVPAPSRLPLWRRIYRNLLAVFRVMKLFKLIHLIKLLSIKNLFYLIYVAKTKLFIVTSTALYVLPVLRRLLINNAIHPIYHRIIQPMFRRRTITIQLPQFDELFFTMSIVYSCYHISRCYMSTLIHSEQVLAESSLHTIIRFIHNYLPSSTLCQPLSCPFYPYLSSPSSLPSHRYSSLSITPLQQKSHSKSLKYAKTRLENNHNRKNNPKNEEKK